MDDENTSANWMSNFMLGLQQLLEHEQISEDAFKKLYTDVAEEWLGVLIADPNRSLRERREFAIGFEARLSNRWGKAFDLFEIALAIAQEAGESKNRHQRPQAVAGNDVAFDVLIRLQARACLTASEVLVLLRAGHAAGAHARWRTLHELAVVGYFIAEHGPDVAERYVLHQTVESYKAALLYEKHYARLGCEPLEEGDLPSLRQRRDELVQRFGKGFLEEYGWAFDVLGRRPTLADLEAKVELGHMRPFYKMASYGIHAHAKGALWNLGVAGNRDMMLAGPSNAGLADPGHGALISLLQVTVVALSRDPDIEDGMALRVLSRLVDLAGEAFLEIHEQLEREELESPQGGN